MENRFFDIDNNVYLNSIYLVALIGADDSIYKLDDLNLRLFLIKNPLLLLNICNNLGIPMNSALFEQFQYSNLQTEMSRYILKVQVKGLLETVNFLYSKDLIEINNRRDVIHATPKCISLYADGISEKIKLEALEINNLFNKVAIKNIKKALFLEGDKLHE